MTIFSSRIKDSKGDFIQKEKRGEDFFFFFLNLLLVLVLWEELMRGSFHLEEEKGIDCGWKNMWEWVEGGRLPRKCCVGVMIFVVSSLFAGKGGLSGQKHIYIYILEFDLAGLEGGGSILFILSTAIDIFGMDGSFDVPPPLIALWTSTSTPLLFLSLWGVYYFHGWIVDHTHKQLNNT